MANQVASCYEVREVWGFGCDKTCPRVRMRAEPIPCVRRASIANFALGKPLPDDDVPVIPPAGYESQNRA